MSDKLGRALKLSRAQSRELFEAGIEKFPNGSTAYRTLDQTVFSILSDWYHGAIIELAKTKGFVGSPEYIAARLGISRQQAATALDRLVRTGLLSRTPSGFEIVSDSNSNLGAVRPVSSILLRKLQRQILEKAILALKEIPVTQRSQTSMTMAIDPIRITKARDLIQKFRRKLCRELQKSSNLCEVYQLSISLFPLSGDRIRELSQNQKEPK